MRKIVGKIKFLDIETKAIWAILFLASIIRFTDLVKRDFWYDEAFTGVAVKESFSNMITMIVNDVHPPMYYLALKAFSYFFSYSVYGIRLFSAIFGVLTVWAVYLVAKELFDRRTALWSSFIASISPFAIQYSQEARMYSMLVFLILISAYFFIKALKTKKTKYFVIWGFFIGLSMLTHYMGLIFSVTYLLAYFIWVYFELYESKENNFTKKIKLFVKNIFSYKKIFYGYAVAFVIFLPWLKNFMHHLQLTGNLTWVKPASFGDIIATLQMFIFGTPLGEMSSGMPQPNEIGFFSADGIKHMVSHISIQMVLAVLFGITIIWLFKKVEKKKILVLLTFSLGFMFIIYMLSIFSKIEDPSEYFVARYLLPAAYFFFIYIGVVLSRTRFSLIAVIFIIYFLMLSFIIPLKNSTGYNQMITHLDKYKNNNFYILNSFDYVISKYYLGADRLTLFNYGWPQYNPDYWAAIGSSLKRTENYNEMKNDPRALIISNKPLTQGNQYFSVDGLQLVDQYNNILIYRFQK
jgi:uncharacterized membrane protein